MAGLHMVMDGRGSWEDMPRSHTSGAASGGTASRFDHVAHGAVRQQKLASLIEGCGKWVGKEVSAFAR